MSNLVKYVVSADDILGIDEFDYYEILGIHPQSSFKEIRHAYRKLAMMYHPDRSDKECTSDVFHKIQQAYNVLVDPAKRKTYDKYGVYLDVPSDLHAEAVTCIASITENIIKQVGSSDIDMDRTSIVEILDMNITNNLKEVSQGKVKLMKSLKESNKILRRCKRKDTSQNIITTATKKTRHEVIKVTRQALIQIEILRQAQKLLVGYDYKVEADDPTTYFGQTISGRSFNYEVDP